MKRIFWLLLPIIGFLIVIMLSLEWLKPTLQTWALKKIEHYSAQNFPIIIRAKELNIQLVPPAIKLEKIDINVKTPESFGFKSLKISEVSANFDFLQLLGGKLFLSSIVVDNTDLALDIDSFISDDESTPINFDPLFALLKTLPVYRVSLIKSKLSVESTKLKLKIRSNDIDIHLVNLNDSVILKTALAHGHVYYGDTGSNDFELYGEAQLDTDSLVIHNAKLSGDDFEIKTKVTFNDIANIFINPKGKLFVEGLINTQELKNLFFEYRIPLDVSGWVRTETNLNFKGLKEFNGQIKIGTEKLKINQFSIGTAQANFQLDGDKINSKEIKLLSNAGDIRIKNLQIDLPHHLPHNGKNELHVKASLLSEQIDLYELLNNLGLTDLPLELFIDANLNCNGPISPALQIKCTGHVNGEHLEVRSGEGLEKTITQIDSFSTQGHVVISNKDVSYEADIKIKDSSGKSSGKISYQEGFVIDYASENLNLKNIDYLAGLKLEGLAKVRGQTSGDSHSAIFNIAVNGKDFYLDDFMIGQASTLIKYEKSNLGFENISGSIGGSKYQAAVKINLDKKNISVEGHSNNIDASDALKAFQRKVNLPFEAFGTGTVNIKVNGPFAFNQLSYDLQTQLFRGSIAGESFDRLNAKIKSEKGEVHFENIVLDKKKSIIQVRGYGHPNGQIEIKADGNNLPIEDSENISKLGASISGLLSFDLAMTGHVLKPDIHFDGNVKQLLIEEQEFPDSFINWKISKQSFEAKANLLGDRLRADVLWPIEENSPFRLKLKARDWNFTTLFTLIGGGSLITDYRSSLSGDLDLSSDRGGILRASGSGTINDFLLKRGSLSLKNQSPMTLTMKNGLAKFENFKVVGPNSIFHITGDAASKDDLSLNIEGKTDLRLFQIFVPFMEDLSGAAEISVKLSGPLSKPEILGSSSVKDGYIRLKAFPHAFEKINTDVQFSQSKVLISKIKGQLGGGVLTGDGQIFIEGLQNIPTLIKAKLENASLNIPDGIRTSGDAEVVFSGSWFPFTLSGIYNVKNGSIIKDFGGDEVGTGLKQSSYLPKVILKNAFEPITLDLRTNIANPIQIKNQQIEGSLTGEIQIKGSPTHPVLAGNINLDKTSKLLFRDKVFEINTGNIKFSDPNEINPDLYISGRGRVSEYDINLLVQGNAKNPQVRLTSIPPLSEQDIVSLLALGVLANKQDKKLSADRATRDEEQTAYAVGSAIINNSNLGKELRNFGVNIQISSSYDNTKDASTQIITISKDVTEKIKASVSTLRGKQNSNEMALRYQINNNLSAVGTLENREPTENSNLSDSQRNSESILGLDLEYKREFK